MRKGIYSMDISQLTRKLYKQFGQSKPMTQDEPCYFLQRNFKGRQDMLIIFKSFPCRFKCKYCNLSNQVWDDKIGLIDQFAFVVEQLKHSLSVIDRVTLSNNGSMLDPNTISLQELEEVLQAIKQIKNVSTVVVETHLCFINDGLLETIIECLGSIKLNILTGFETLDENIMSKKLGKQRICSEFERQLDVIADCGCDFTAYILYKPDQAMTDDEAYEEAFRSAAYLIKECRRRKIDLTLRINPMFAAYGTEWAALAKKTPLYSPPRISDVYRLALELNKSVPTYIGLSTEGKNEQWGSYRINTDFKQELLLDIIHFNNER